MAIYEEGFTQNRELSWIEFDRRILEEAEDTSVPLLERLKFVEIFCSNLDEFFQVRVANLVDMVADSDNDIDSKSGMDARAQLDAIQQELEQLYPHKDTAYDKLIDALREEHIEILNYAELEPDELEFAKTRFTQLVLPGIQEQTLSIDEIDKLDSDTVYHIGFITGSDHKKLVAVSASEDVPAHIVIAKGDNGISLIPTEELIKGELQLIAAPFGIEDEVTIRLTRSQSTRSEEENGNLPENLKKRMEALVNLRENLGFVRIECDRELPHEIMHVILDVLEINPKNSYVTETPLGIGFVYGIEGDVPESIRSRVCYRAFEPVEQFAGDSRRIMDIALEQDILSAYPYQSMSPLLRLLDEAAEDRCVSEICMTIYRFKDHSKIVESLCRAAENGKKVRVLVEVRARFDEAHNLALTKQLEDAGCKVYYGSDTLKAHSKVLQITIEDGDDKRYITQVSTGNYNEKTAKRYTDLSLITSSKKIGKDMHKFFKNVFKGDTDDDYEHLLVSPANLKDELLKLMDREIDKKYNGRIFMKCNSISDSDVIEKLSEASNAGVQIRMIVRGICCILPHVEYCTENIEIVNVVGRYLEHSRVYVFGSGEDEEMYISSADMMTRNTERRFEMACPVYDEKCRSVIRRILKANFMDNVKGRRMSASGKYEIKAQREPAIDSQDQLMTAAENGEL